MFQKLSLTTIALLVSGVSVAASNGLYNDLDVDKDGAISHEEATALPGLSSKWTELDTNADGKLDKAEFAKLEEVVDIDSK